MSGEGAAPLFACARRHRAPRAASALAPCGRRAPPPLPLTPPPESLSFAATCHAPDRAACFAQIFKALKPGGVFGGCVLATRRRCVFARTRGTPLCCECVCGPPSSSALIRRTVARTRVPPRAPRPAQVRVGDDGRLQPRGPRAPAHQEGHRGRRRAARHHRRAGGAYDARRPGGGATGSVMRRGVWAACSGRRRYRHNSTATPR